MTIAELIDYMMDVEGAEYALEQLKREAARRDDYDYKTWRRLERGLDTAGTLLDWIGNTEVHLRSRLPSWLRRPAWYVRAWKWMRSRFRARRSSLDDRAQI